MDNRPIGIYDSGIGGLTGLKALRRLLPGEDLVFFADTGRMPYGPRSREELCRIAGQDMDFLASFGVKAILAACGTISSAARPVLESYPIPAFGVLAPAVEAMAALPGERPLAVLATAASIESGQFTDPLRARCPGREIIGLACPEFAPMIEAGHIDREDAVLTAAAERPWPPCGDGRRTRCCWAAPTTASSRRPSGMCWGTCPCSPPPTAAPAPCGKSWCGTASAPTGTRARPASSSAVSRRTLTPLPPAIWKWALSTRNRRPSWSFETP